jgi:sugar/nucleoside kinase (ribokinase family)
MVRAMPDVCVVGHITKDLIRIPGKPDKEMAGGSAYYVSVALRSLGLDVAVITKVAARDEALLDGLRARGIHVINRPSAQTTIFENTYTDASLTVRKQRVRGVADPLSSADVQAVTARAFHVGPLTREEISLDVLRTIRDRTSTLAFDAQGMLRIVADEEVRLDGWSELDRALPYIDELKVDDVEAAHLVGEHDVEHAAESLARFGAKEVLVTFADRGSLVRAAGTSTRIPAIPPKQIVDATGCGDTYAAGYLFARLDGETPGEAAVFAAAAASLKLEAYGPFEGSADAVRTHIQSIYSKVS